MTITYLGHFVSNMEEGTLLEKVFNKICDSGGFVELSELLKHPLPLASIATKLQAQTWLESQGGRFILIQDHNREVTGVRVDLKKKICQQYLDKGCSRRTQRKYLFWHICKRFIEGNCNGKCNLSHNFLDKDNIEKTKKLELQKFSNSTVRKIVLCSLPQVCQLYLVNECERVECSFLHLCPGMVREFLCNCAFSHCLVDTHNKGIIKRYDLLPSPLMSLDFVCCNILVLNEPKLTSKYQLSGDKGIAIHASNALTTATVPEVTSVSSPSLNTGCHMKDDQSNGAAETVSSIISTTCQPKQTEFVSGVKSEIKTGKRKKKRNRKRMKSHVGQVKATGPRPNCNSTHPVNNLASHSALSGSTDTPQFLNIEERDNLSDACSNENNDTSSNSMKGNQSLAERKQRDSHLSVVRFNFEDIRGNENLNKNNENLQENSSNTSSGNRAWTIGAGYHCADKETVSSDPFETVTKAVYNSPTQSTSPPENISETFDEKLPRPSSQTQVSEVLRLSKATPLQTQMCKVAPSEIKVSESALSQIQVPKSVSL